MWTNSTGKQAKTLWPWGNLWETGPWEGFCEKSVSKGSEGAFVSAGSLCAAVGALCPLYGRLWAMSSQRDLLQDQLNLHGSVNQKIGSLLRALPTSVENHQDEARLRQRRAKVLVYVFRRAVIAALASNRLRLLAQHSSSLFIWTDGSRGSTGIRVCVGESRGRRNVSRKWTVLKVLGQITWSVNDKEHCHY